MYFFVGVVFVVVDAGCGICWLSVVGCWMLLLLLLLMLLFVSVVKSFSFLRMNCTLFYKFSVCQE